MKRANKLSMVWIAIAVLSLGLNGYLLFLHSGSTDLPHPKIQNPKSKISYTCPMHPTIIQDQPGKCPICGMELVRSGDEALGTTAADSHEGGVTGRSTVTIDPKRQQLIGLKTSTVERRELRTERRMFGRVQVDQTRVRKVNVKVEGYVEKILVDFTGKSVRRGDPLFTYYSPELTSAQQELLLALKGAEASGDNSTASLVRQKLLLWDVTPEQIERLEKSGEVTRTITYYSPVDGVVTMKEIVEGSFLMAGEMPYEITDMRRLWVITDAYQSDASNIGIGDSAEVRLESLPDHTFNGRVTFIDPSLDPDNRTFKVRVEVDNPSGLLKPDMFADVTLRKQIRDVMSIPSDAVIPSGQGYMVFVSVGDGKFEPRAVTLGQKSGDYIEVTDGLAFGETVVMRANFLVDSESSLRAALASFGGN
jgi:Cu(I)/Ag(I) efflux system membrane fusion protein